MTNDEKLDLILVRVKRIEEALNIPAIDTKGTKRKIKKKKINYDALVKQALISGKRIKKSQIL